MWPNLFVTDGSVMTTGAAANPTLTIVALAMRQADHIAGELARGHPLTRRQNAIWELGQDLRPRPPSTANRVGSDPGLRVRSRRPTVLEHRARLGR